MAMTREAERDAAIHRALDGVSPELSRVVTALAADREHPLNMTTALDDPERRERVLDLLVEMARGEITKREPLATYLERTPGQGPLFAPLRDGERKDAGRTANYVATARTTDPAGAVRAYPTADERRAVSIYGRKLALAVEPAVAAEVVMLAERAAVAVGVVASVSIRTKEPGGIMDKVQRMTVGSAGRGGRPEYSVGDVIDAVGGRITVANIQALAAVLDEARKELGARILELENLYLEPKAHDLTYRVIAMVVSIEVDKQPYTYELQLTTERASVAADLGHNTLYKIYVPVTEAGRQAILRAKDEAAALDQAETYAAPRSERG